MSSYTVYRTTNQLNGMFYIGVHKTRNPNDSYLGSGKRLKYAIAKYGVENFQKEVLFVFSTPEEAYSKEKELVTEDVLDSGACYNLKIGGDGGWDFANKVRIPGDRIKAGSIGGKSYAAKLKIDPVFKKTLSDRICKQNKKFHVSGKMRPPDCTGRIYSEETKQKMKESHIGKHEGFKNSQFGSIWITDGVLSKKIKKNQEIPDGWRCGRVF